MNHPDTTPTAHPDNSRRFAGLAIGNTRVRLGLFDQSDLHESVGFDAREPKPLTDKLKDWAEAGSFPVVVSSVSPDAAKELIDAISASVPAASILRIGQDLPIPLSHLLDEAGWQSVGQDRLLCALGAYTKASQACIVVDVGTAITVDFVDGQGTFHGGAIAPGIRMMLASLHNHTAQLPAIDFVTPPSDQPFGINTPDAMCLGVAAAVRGLVRELAERYAHYYESYPQIIATGGDMGILEEDGLVEHFVPDLQLIGLQACVAASIRAESEDD